MKDRDDVIETSSYDEASSQSATTTSQTTTSKGVDPLKEGPCSSYYDIMTKCQQEKGLNNNTSKDVKKMITLCVTETDLFIKCIKRNPLHFHQHAPEAMKLKK